MNHLTKYPNRYGVLVDSVTGELDADSVTEWEARTGRKYQTARGPTGVL